MAFIQDNFIPKRKTFLFPDLSSSIYISDDGISTILSDGYFPNWFGLDNNSVVPLRDTLMIMSTSDYLVKEYLVISDNPVGLSIASVPSETEYLMVNTSGAIVTSMPIFFYKNNVFNVALFIIPASLSWTITQPGKINFNDFSLPSGFTPANFPVYLSIHGIYNGTPIYFNFTLSNDSPYLSLDHTFEVGDTLSITNALTLYTIES
jgi:hypothetical protein